VQTKRHRSPLLGTRDDKKTPGVGLLQGGERSGIEVVGMRMGGEHEVDVPQRLGGGRGRHQAEVGEALSPVLLRKPIREVRVDEDPAVFPLHQESGLAKPIEDQLA
jgi:hypothetical protein